MADTILRPSVLAMGRGLGVSAEGGRTFWPSAADAVARHNATKMNRLVIIVSFADRGESRTGHDAKTTPSDRTGLLFCVGLETKKDVREALRLETKERGCGLL